MANLSITCCRSLAEARRAKGITQSALAARVGCKQSAISMLEAGQASKIAWESVQRIADILEVKLDPADSLQTPERPAVPLSGHPFCPNAACLSNVPYLVEGRLLFWPAAQPSGARDASACAVCGELLERRCPNCGAALTQGACCPDCGRPKVTDTVSGTLAETAEWAARRRRDIAEWRALQV